MRRRDLFLIISIASGLWPFAALGEPQKVPRVGVLVVGSAGSERFWQIFRKLMEERGYIDGQTVHYEFRSDQGQVKRLPELAAELIHLKVDVLVTWFTPAAKAAQDATREIPIVMALAGNPVETGLVKSLAHPGGNITGLAGVGAELAGKSVELIREMLPTASRIAALANAPDPFSKPFTEYILLAGAATRVEIYPVMVQRTEELSDAFATMKENRIDAFIVQPSLPTTRVAALAVEHRIPAISVINGFAENGGLMSYQTSEVDMYRLSADYTDKILKGAKPGELPILQPTHFEIVVNLKTARTIGVTISPTFLGRVDKTIE